MTTKEVLEIQGILEAKANERTKASFQKYVPSSQKTYGVKVPELNLLAAKYKNSGFALVEALWKAGSFEEKLLAAKLLGKICKKDSERALDFIRKASRDISDWAVCDTLATQGMGAIAKKKQKDIFELAENLICSKNFWERRLAIVLLINFVKDGNLRSEIRKILEEVENDKNHYVKKAVEWIRRKLE